MTSKAKSITRLNPSPEGFGETPDELDAEAFSSEIPLQHSHSVFEDDDIGLYVGLWDTESMVETGGPYACDEFMWLLEGECQIRNNRSGTIDTVRAGTPFVIPRAYDCQWQQHGYLKKYYVISEHPEEAVPTMPVHEGIIVPRTDAVLTAIGEDAPFAMISGSGPQQNVCYEDSRGRFSVATWASDAFVSEQNPLPYNMFACVFDGCITLSDTMESNQEFRTGDAFFVPEGLLCNATVAESVQMYTVIIKSS